MAVTFAPASGVLGSVQLGAYTFCADTWVWDGRINIIPTPSFCGGAFMEYAEGKKNGVFSFSGVWDLGNNPFVRAFKLGFVTTLILRISNAITARSANCIIAEWRVTDDSDGVSRYTCSLVGDFIFNDFSNTTA